jgi:hypothetical protein
MADDYKRMQVKVLYSFNNNATVFLSRSKQMHSIKIAQIPMADGGETLTLGAFDLKGCVLQIIKSSPENFKLQTEDYAVYYKDITEQPDEPFVANGVLLNLLKASKQHLIPGRVCQNLSASFLFGDQSGGSSQTLEVRLKLHTIEKSPDQIPTEVKPMTNRSFTAPDNEKRAHTFVDQPHPQQKRARPLKPPPPSSSSAVKATRTKSLPIFYPQNQQIFNIINADKSNAPSKYDNKSVQDRFKLAPFLQAKILENPQKKYNNQIKQVATKHNAHLAASEPQRAMRTRSMMSNRQPMMISSPINEETDALDTDYQDTNVQIDNGLEDEDEHDQRTSSPYTPQQPPYNPMGLGPSNEASAQHQEQRQSEVFSSASQFQSLPDLEDLDSRKTHAIPHYRLAKCHGLVCMNTNCATTNSITWRYFETGYHPNYLSLHRAKDFDIKHYDGMIGPLCNACYLFLRNKGFMRPEAVVKKYMQQQKYKKELKDKDDQDRGQGKQFASSPPAYHKFTTPSHTPSVINRAILNNNQNSNNVQKPASVSNDSNRPTPNYQNYNELNDFMNQLNSFGGPLTDLDLPQDNSRLNLGVTPPMMATKSNTRVINLYDEGEDKENWPPQATSDDHITSDNKINLNEFETMIVKSFSNPPEKESQHDQTAWMNNLFGEPTPKDHLTPGDGASGKSGITVEALHPDNAIIAYGSYGSPTELNSLMPKPSAQNTEREGCEATKAHPNLPQLRTFTTHNKSSSPVLSQLMAIANMPSSPLLTHDNEDEGIDFEGLGKDRYHMSSPTARASRADTSTLLMSTTYLKGEGVNGGHGSTPNTDFYSNDDPKEGTHAHIKSARPKHVHK